MTRQLATLVRAGVSVFSPDGTSVEFHKADEVCCTTSAWPARTGAPHSSRYPAPGG